MVWHFIGVYIINRTLHDRLEIRNFSSRVEKYFTRSLRSLVKYFSILEEKFRISARPCNNYPLFINYLVQKITVYPGLSMRPGSHQSSRTYSEHCELLLFKQVIFESNSARKYKNSILYNSSLPQFR